MTKSVRYGVLIGLGLVLAASFSAAGWLIYRSRHRVASFDQVESALAAGDRAKAKSLLGRILQADPNSERAMAAMADIARDEENFVVEARCLGRLIKLNEFEASYPVRYRTAVLRSRDFKHYAIAFGNIPAKARRDEDEAWVVYAKYIESGAGAAQKDYRNLVEKHPEVGGRPVGQMLDIVFSVHEKKELSVTNLTDRLQRCVASDDEAVRQEAGLALADVYLTGHQFELAEKSLKAVMEFNPVVSVPKLVRLYLIENRIEDAIRLNGEFLVKHPNRMLALEQAELLAAARRVDLLPKISALFTDSSFRTLALKNYLDALAAYDRGDFAKMKESLEMTRLTVRSPWACRMTALSELRAKAPDRLEKLEKAWKTVRWQKPFFDCREVVWKACKQALIEDYQAGRPVEELAPLAAAIQYSDQREDPELSRLLVLAGLVSGTMSGREVEATLKRHPSDPNLLSLAAESALRNERYGDALAYAGRLEKTGTNLVAAASLAMRARFSLAESPKAGAAEKEAASAELKRFLGKVAKPSAIDQATIWRYVCTMKSRADIEFVKAKLEKYAPFCAVLLLEADGRAEEALDALEKIETDDPSLQYWVARHLAGGNRDAAALSRYLALPEGLRNDPLTQVNVSELYAATGDADKAYATAEAVWKELPADAVVQTCYARRLSERGEWAKIRSVAKMPADPRTASPMLLKVWIPAMEKGIAADWEASQQVAARDACRQLQRFAPDNEVARDYLAKYEAWQEAARKKKASDGEQPESEKSKN